MSEGRARYAEEQGTWILKLDGDIRHPLSPAINALLDRALADPALQHFVVDLTEVENIDSTNLGVLARIANRMAELKRPRPTLIATGRDIPTLLRAVFFDRVFNLVQAVRRDDGRLTQLPELPADEVEMLRLVLEAHRRLCAIHDKNHAVFRDVIEALEQDLRRR